VETEVLSLSQQNPATGTYTNPFLLRQFSTAVNLQTCIRQIFGSNLGWNTGYPN
jgi:hypothetical protein